MTHFTAKSVLFAVTVALTATSSLLASGASAEAEPTFECRKAARTVYKVEALQCEQLSSSTDVSVCVRSAREIYRAHKAACGTR